MVHEEDWSRGALSPRLRPTQVVEKNWLDVLGLHKWEIWERERLVLGEGVGNNNYEIVLRVYCASYCQLPL